MSGKRMRTVVALLVCAQAATAFTVMTERTGAQDSDVVAVIDVTAQSECEIEYQEWADPEQTVLLSTSGSLPCAGNASVIYSRTMTTAEAEASGYNYVTLTGDSSADEAAVSGLIDTISPIEEGPEVTTASWKSGKPGVAVAKSVSYPSSVTYCNSGYYPSYFSARGSYVVYKNDNSVYDTRVQYSIAYNRISCTYYQLYYVTQYLSQVSAQTLYWESYYYSRRYGDVGGTYGSSATVCARHVSGGTQSSITRYPGWYIATNGLYSTKTTNDGRDGCWFFGETWTGQVYLNGPMS